MMPERLPGVSGEVLSWFLEIFHCLQSLRPLAPLPAAPYDSWCKLHPGAIQEDSFRVLQRKFPCKQELKWFNDIFLLCEKGSLFRPNVNSIGMNWRSRIALATDTRNIDLYRKLRRSERKKNGSVLRVARKCYIRSDVWGLPGLYDSPHWIPW